MKKLLPWLLTILMSITLISIAAFVVWGIYNPDNPLVARDRLSSQAIDSGLRRLSSDELVKVTSELSELTTNLADQNYIVKISFAFQLNDQQAKKEFDKIINYKIKPLIIRALADTSPDEISGAKGKDELSAKLIELINPELYEGKVTNIHITDFVMTPI
jgi:flagellar FliL protein